MNLLFFITTPKPTNYKRFKLNDGNVIIAK